MNCTVIQRRLLWVARPEQAPVEVQEHLAQCASCRAWLRRLVQVERLIPQLPVPTSTAKLHFLERLKEDGRRMNKAILVRPSTFTLRPFKKERALRKLSVAFALAASLLFFALVWWSWPHNPQPPFDPWRTEQTKLEQRLNNALLVGTPKGRVLQLAKLADEVHGEAGKLISNSERLEEWSQFYSRIVGQHLIAQARQLPFEDRQAVLQEIAMRLDAAESEATRLAAQCKAASPRSAAALERMAFVSQKSERELLALLKG